jgi:23S rRNA-intervening sequence protein
MTAIRDFRDLIVWQRAMDLVVEIYAVTERFPVKERFGLTTQARSAAAPFPPLLPRAMGAEPRENT